MEYRGKFYIVAKGDEPDSWKWAADLDERTVKFGEAKTRAMAIRAAMQCIDKALASPPPAD